MPLLIHSMSELWPFILPLLERSHSRVITEVGGEAGGTTRLLLDHAGRNGGWVYTIDVAPQAELKQLFGPGVPGSLIEQSSLDALLELPLADAYLIDGDHNYFTVLHELMIIFARHRVAGAHPLVFLHDVGWPCGRRDSYYRPESIPVEWRQPYRFDGGARLDEVLLVEGGFRGCGVWAFAVQEGGPRNGVRTAIDDFISAANEPLLFQVIPAVFGMGVLYSANAPWAGAVTDFLAPYHNHPVLAALERNRLENYLRVLEVQDESERTRPGAVQAC